MTWFFFFIGLESGRIEAPDCTSAQVDRGTLTSDGEQTDDTGGRAVDGGQEDSESLASSVTRMTRGRPGPGPAD